jgi:hypothetical protein
VTKGEVVSSILTGSTITLKSLIYPAPVASNGVPFGVMKRRHGLDCQVKTISAQP